jgi:hypothetical protein
MTPSILPLLSAVDAGAVFDTSVNSFFACIEYAFAMRVPLLAAVVVLLLPVIAFRSPTRVLLRGLFDVTPLSLLAVTLAALAAAGTITDTAGIIYSHSFERLREFPPPPQLLPYARLVFTIAISLPVVLTALIFSIKQRSREASPWPWLAMAAIGFAFSFYIQQQAAVLAQALVQTSLSKTLAEFLGGHRAFRGYVRLPMSPSDPWIDHVGALAGFAISFVIYISLGVYGWWRLGKNRTVPALCSVLMVVMLLCWTLAGMSFFFDFWRTPLLLILVVVGMITAQSRQSDHFYTLISRTSSVPAPAPAEVLNASHSSRIVVVAANGGGIQAAAWTAQVLQGLWEEHGDAFRRSLRLISSVSGGSVGNACFLYSLAESANAKNPATAAALSSLDEVAWGLAWPDLLRSVFPWVTKKLIGRGRALEKAWCLNSAPSPALGGSKMDRPLSDWNQKVADGSLPAVLFNATVSESGARLLLGTTRLSREHSRGRARVDASELHTVDGEQKDVSVVTAARLSATFPYVTPASRSDAPGAQPHIVDGGYYDNYGMSTLVEWLDEGLTHTNERYSILVLQIHGAPVLDEATDALRAKNRGWFYQAFAPISTMTTVRTAGQIAHNDTELTLLQEKWSTRVPIHTVTFEFPDPNAPLSWHLTRSDQDAIKDTWSDKADVITGKKLLLAKQLVRDFLAGSDALNCPCPVCRNRGEMPDQFKAFARGV